MHAVRRKLTTTTIALLALAAPVFAADWPQYRGPNHDGKSPDPIRTDWSAQAPRVVWKAPLGLSLGTFAVVGDKAYIMVSKGGDEGLQCLGVNDGKEQWFAPVGRTINDRQGGNGPRTTPMVVGDKVYALGTYFNLVCVNAADGKPVWTKDLAKEYGAQNETQGIKEWGNAASPIVEGDLVIVPGGGRNGQTFLAFDRNSGELKWKAGSERVTHATPTPATIHGVRQIIFFTHSGLVSIEPKSGKELWREAFPWNVSTASAPVVGGKDGDVVYCAAAYTVGSAAFKISKDGEKFSAKQLWRLKGNDNGNHWMTPVHHDGHVYGLYGHRRKGDAKLECREIETGDVKWSELAPAGAGGAVTMAGKHLVVQHEDGKIVLVEATPEAYKKVAETQPLKGKAWSMAVPAGGRLFVRTDKEAACLDVAAERSAAAE